MALFLRIVSLWLLMIKITKNWKRFISCLAGLEKQISIFWTFVKPDLIWGFHGLSPNGNSSKMWWLPHSSFQILCWVPLEIWFTCTQIGFYMLNFFSFIESFLLFTSPEKYSYKIVIYYRIMYHISHTETLEKKPQDAHH